MHVDVSPAGHFDYVYLLTDDVATITKGLVYARFTCTSTELAERK